jgi:hypothetical protein
MPNSKQEKHNTFFDEQKPLCNKNSFPSNGDDTLTTQSVMIKKQDDADRIYKDKNIMKMMYSDGFVWNPTLKNGTMKFKFSRQTSIDYQHHFDNDPIESTMIHYKKGLFIDKNIDVDNKYLPLLGIETTKKYDKYAINLSKSLQISVSHANDILKNGATCDVKNNPLIEE